MFVRITLLPTLALLFVLFSAAARADEPPTQLVPEQRITFVDRVRDGAQASVVAVGDTLDKALDLIGIRYRRGGTSPENGFDCSGFVGHVFREGLGLYLPRSSKEMSKTGEDVSRKELQPGDLVFFNTMRRAFSHVGIYLGDNKFVHSPRAGGTVRVEDMTDRYWRKRYNGARRVADD
jgi:cell wall-associated NlpC family hydrolase